MPSRSSSSARAPGRSPPRCTAGLVSDLVPDAQVTVYADGSGAYPDEPGINAVVGELWGTFANDPGLGRQRGPHCGGLGRRAALGAGRPARSGDRHVTIRLCLRRGADEFHGPPRLGHVRRRCVDGRQTKRRSKRRVSSSTASPLPVPSTRSFAMTRSTRWRSTGSSCPNGSADVVAGDDVADVVCTECGDPAPPTTG